MSIADKITRLQTAKSGIASAITAKGGTVGASDGFEEFASDIASIPSSGSSDNGGTLWWRRALGAPNYDDVDLGETVPDVVYLTIDARHSKKWHFGIEVSSSATFYVKRGVMSNGIFTPSETLGTTNRYFQFDYNTSWGDWVCIQVTSSNNTIECVKLYGTCTGPLYEICCKTHEAGRDFYTTCPGENRTIEFFRGKYYGSNSYMYRFASYAASLIDFDIEFCNGQTASLNGNMLSSSNVHHIDFSKININDSYSAGVGHGNATKSINISTWDKPHGATNFSGLTLALTDFWPPQHIDVDMNFSAAQFLSVASLNRIISALDQTDTTKTLNIGSVNKSKLTAEEIAVATGKGWTVT